MYRFGTFIIIFTLLSCTDSKINSPISYVEGSVSKVENEDSKILNEKWYEGKAEINTYELQQNRYNGIHSGEAVMIFVTEDFLKDKQVKNDTYTSKFSTPILKNNQIRQFATGLYDYSIFTSVFTEVKDNLTANSLKITTSSQDWCGQSFLQLNKVERDFRIRGFSYFEKEGDFDKTIRKNLIVDEIYNIIRIDENLLPIGDIKAIPSTIYNRLKHEKLKTHSAKAIKVKYEGELTEEEAMVYVIKFPELQLEYKFIYLNNALRDILEWSESYPSSFDGVIRTTIARRKSVEWTDYWSKNNPSDTTLRKDLQLRTF